MGAGRKVISPYYWNSENKILMTGGAGGYISVREGILENPNF